MNRSHGDAIFTTSFIEDAALGFAGFELDRMRDGKPERVATIVFWDAMGQFYIETFGEVPLKILEELIEETRAAIPTS